MLDIQRKHENNARLFQRVKVVLEARYLLDDGTEHIGKTIDVSPNSASIKGPGKLNIGSRVIVYIDQIGRVEGTVQRVTGGNFALSFKTTSAKRERMAETLTWLANYNELNLVSERRHERFRATVTRSHLALRDGSLLVCTIIDVSLSGAKIGLLAKPNIGETVVLGQIKAKVIRHTPEGIGIEFDNFIERHKINSLLKPVSENQ